MSTMGVRRLKERGGAGGKVTAVMPNSKPLTPLSDKSRALLSTTTSINRSAAKEKPRSVSRGPAMSQKPEMRPMPRMDKSSAAGLAGVDGEIKRRLSSSSVPRGRSSSPSDFSRVLSDIGRTRVSRVPVEQVGRAPITKNGRSLLEMSAVRAGNGKRLSGFSGSERKGVRESSLKSSEKRVYGGLKENMNVGAKLGKECGNVLTEISAVDDRNDLNSSSNQSAPQKSEGLYDCLTDDILSANCEGGDPQEPSVRESNVVVKCNGKNPDLQKARPDMRSKVYGTSLKGLSVFRDKEVNAVGNSGRVGGKNNSKLHEKLAFLEDKVKRIASDIKRTKEMLDMNNPDASKVIISDIQEKISGIEKAMNNVVGDSGRKSSSSMSTDEEARLLSHHRLLKSHSSIKTSSSGSQSDKFKSPNCESDSAHRPVNYSIDEDPIAVEFLSSLNQQASKVNMDTCNKLEVGEVQETEVATGSSVQQALIIEKYDNETGLTSDE